MADDFTPPRYDDVFEQGTAALDGDDDQADEWAADPRTTMAKLDIDTTQVDIRDVFELDAITVKVEDLWRVVFGPNKPFPSTGTPWMQAMTHIQAACMRVRWQWMDEPKRPPLRLLPIGVEVDDGE